MIPHVGAADDGGVAVDGDDLGVVPRGEAVAVGADPELDPRPGGEVAGELVAKLVDVDAGGGVGAVGEANRDGASAVGEIGDGVAQGSQVAAVGGGEAGNIDIGLGAGDELVESVDGAIGVTGAQPDRLLTRVGNGGGELGADAAGAVVLALTATQTEVDSAVGATRAALGERQCRCL